MKTKTKAKPKKKATNGKHPDAKQISESVGKLPYDERNNLISHLSKVGEEELRMKGDGKEPDGSGYAQYPTE